MEREGGASQEGPAGGPRGSEGQGPRIHDTADPVREDDEPLALPSQSPLFHAEHAARYDRQELIKKYQARHDCRLVVIIDIIFGDNIPLLEELLYNANPSEDLHIILDSPGGDGETAVRLVRSAQARCRELTVIVPNQAKSAATLFCNRRPPHSHGTHQRPGAGRPSVPRWRARESESRLGEGHHRRRRVGAGSRRSEPRYVPTPSLPAERCHGDQGPAGSLGSRTHERPRRGGAACSPRSII